MAWRDWVGRILSSVPPVLCAGTAQWLGAYAILRLNRSLEEIDSGKHGQKCSKSAEEVTACEESSQTLQVSVFGRVRFCGACFKMRLGDHREMGPLVLSS
jgi:hypothetical protein